MLAWKGDFFRDCHTKRVELDGMMSSTCHFGLKPHSACAWVSLYVCKVPAWFCIDNQSSLHHPSLVSNGKHWFSLSPVALLLLNAHFVQFELELVINFFPPSAFLRPQPHLNQGEWRQQTAKNMFQKKKICTLSISLSDWQKKKKEFVKQKEGGGGWADS